MNRVVTTVNITVVMLPLNVDRVVMTVNITVVVL